MTLKTRVRGGRLVVDEPSDVGGAEVELSPPTVLGCRLCGATQVAAVQVSVARLSAATINPDARPDLKDDVCVNRISGFE